MCVLPCRYTLPRTSNVCVGTVVPIPSRCVVLLKNRFPLLVNELPAPANCTDPGEPDEYCPDADTAAVFWKLPSANVIPLIAAVFARFKLPASLAAPYIATALPLTPVTVLVPTPTLPVKRLLVPPTLMLLPMPAPPATNNAPVVEEVLVFVLLTDTFCPNMPYTLLVNVFTVAVSVL